MSISDFLNWAIPVALLLMAILAITDFVRFRDAARFDIALMFSSLAAIVLLQGLTLVLRQQSPWVGQIGSLLLLAQPFLLVRLIQHFRQVPRAILAATFGSMLLSWVLVLVLPSPRPQLATLLIVMCFVWVEIYAASAFVRGAIRTRGVTRPRLTLAAIGSGLLALVLLLAGLNQLLPGDTSIATPLAQALAFIAMVSYYLSFAPPYWLRQAWQLAELQRFLRATSGRPVNERVATSLELLCLTGTRALGGLAAAVVLWDAETKRLAVRASHGEQPLTGQFEPSNGAMGRAWQTRRPIIARTPAEVDADALPLLDAVHARAVLVAPISTPVRAWGLLLVFYHRAPLFASDDLQVLMLITEQSAIALDYAALLDEQQTLVKQLRQQTVQLATTNQELEAFSYSVAHDLRAPLRSLVGFSRALIEDYSEHLDTSGLDYLRRIGAAAQRMGDLIDGLLALSRITRGDIQHETVDLSIVAQTIAADLQHRDDTRQVEWQIAPHLVVAGDARLLRVVLENLLGNAWKFTAPCSAAQIELGRRSDDQGSLVYFVRDNGVGFDMAYAEKLFGVFQRLHAFTEFEGTGIGLATVQRIVHRHGGRIWATSSVGQGATFAFTLG